MTTLLGGFTRIYKEVRPHPIHLGDQVLYVDLIVLGFERFHYILGLEWMAQNEATINTTN